MSLTLWNDFATRNWFLLLVFASAGSYFFIFRNFQHIGDEAAATLQNEYPIIGASAYKTILGRLSLNDFGSTVRKLKRAAKMTFSNKFSEYYQEAVESFDSRGKLELAIKKAIFSNGKQRTLRVAAIGGSSTVPHGISTRRGFFNLFCHWLSDAFYQVNVEVNCDNYALGATGSNYFSLCLNEYLNITSVDILMVEFALNDWHFFVTKAPGYDRFPASPFEELTRLALRKNPSLVIIVVIFTPLRHLLLLDYPPKCPNTIESAYREVSSHYELTTVTFKHLFCNANSNISSISREEQLRLAGIYLSKLDHSHSSERVHLALAEFLVYHIKQTVLHLISQLNTAESLAKVKEKAFIDEARIIEEDMRQPLYSTTRTDFDADCFFHLKQRHNVDIRLSKAIVGSLKRSELMPDLWLDHLQIAFFGNQTSLAEFNLTKLKTPNCRNNAGFIPRLAIAYQLCNCTEGINLNVSASFTFEHGFITTDYSVPLVVTGFKPNYVHELAPRKSGKVQQDGNACHTHKLKSIYIRFEKDVTLNYPLLLNTVIVYYDCCEMEIT